MKASSGGMRMHVPRSLLLLAALAIPGIPAHAQGDAPLPHATAVTAPTTTATPLGADIGGLLDHARNTNPSFAAQRAETAAARERVDSAGALPDPNVQVELMDFTNEMRGGGTTLVPGRVGETRYRFIQPLPGWGKRELQSRTAAAKAEQATAGLDAAWLDLALTIKQAWLRYYAADREAALARETLALLGGLEEATLARYRQGLAPQQAVLRAQREITSQRLAQVGIEQRRRGAVAALNGLLARAPHEPLAAPGEPSALPAALDLAALVARARAANPALAADERGIEAARLERERTWADRYPDYSIGVTNNRPRGEDQSWDLMFEVMIPLQQSARRAREREAAYMVTAADARRAATGSRLAGEIGAAWANFTSARETQRLLRGTLLPQAQATRDATRAAFETGRADFDAVLEAERQLVDTRMNLLQSEVEARMALFEIEKLVGESL
ncbi:TolC family protein [Aromatoleum petrolei]|uniref:TolC family protein n=1 Tax=Aromatoleum petrolei TaxID=76116 RepID=A0ABX1MLB3_9RHOO|nr:TolC family protein [Aromatoleum petrolei]NMF88760.1 TolC family protein [Aromatoleum petrolei]QTQ36041.1 Putative outer membrane efflux protein [Aromatoleum petrolei]